MRVIEHENLKWIDILKPTDQDTKFLEETFGFHHLIVEEIKTPTYHPLIGSYKTYLFWILHFPDSDSKSDQIQTIEVDFLITQDALITIRYQDFDDFDEIFENIRSSEAKYFNKTTGHIFYQLIKQLFNKIFPELDRTKEAIDRAEDRLLEGVDEKVIEEIASIKHNILDLLKALKPQKSVWDAATDVALTFWGERLKPYFYDLVADYNRTLHFVETHKEVMDSLHLTASSLLDNKRNYVIKILTIFTAIILPLSLVASIWGMNLTRLPLAEHPFAFWWFLGGMMAVTILMLLFFRKRRWI